MTRNGALAHGRPTAASARGDTATIAHIRLNCKITSAAEQGQQSVLNLIQSCSRLMSLVNASTAWHCIARLDTEDAKTWEVDPRIAALKRRTAGLLESYLEGRAGQEPQARCVATIAWSCAKLKIRDPALEKGLAALAVRWLPLFKTFELSNLLWGFAKLQVQSPTVFSAAQHFIAGHAEEFSTRSLSMASWAFATISYQAQPLLCRMANVFVKRLVQGEEANPVTVANMIWALATARVQLPRESLKALGAVARRSLAAFKAHELSVMLWAFARLSFFHQGLFEDSLHLLCRCKALRDEIHSQGIANLLWAFARQRLELAPKKLALLLAALQPTCLRLLPKLNAVEVSSLVWAITRLSPRWGEQQAADRVLVQVAQCLTGSPAFLASVSSQGAARLLAAYSEFFYGASPVPVPCEELLSRLVAQCMGLSPAVAQDPEEDQPAELSQQQERGAALLLPNKAAATAAVAQQQRCSPDPEGSALMPRPTRLQRQACDQVNWEPAYVQPSAYLATGNLLTLLTPGDKARAFRPMSPSASIPEEASSSDEEASSRSGSQVSVVDLQEASDLSTGVCKLRWREHDGISSLGLALVGANGLPLGKSVRGKQRLRVEDFCSSSSTAAGSASAPSTLDDLGEELSE